MVVPSISLKNIIFSLYASTEHMKTVQYTVPKEFLMHETFPKLLGKISKTT
jgi:hypothetical protein